MKSARLLLPLALLGCTANPSGVSDGAAPPGTPVYSGSAPVCDGVPGPTRMTPVDTSPGSTDDSRALASVHCAAPATDGDLTVDLVQTSFESGLFVATVHRSRPSPFDGAYCVTMQFSGDWGWQVHDRPSTPGGFDYLISMLIGLDDHAASPGTIGVATMHGASDALTDANLHCSDVRN